MNLVFFAGSALSLCALAREARYVLRERTVFRTMRGHVATCPYTEFM